MADLLLGRVYPVRVFNHKHELDEFLALEKQDTLTEKKVNFTKSRTKRKKPFPKHLRAKNFQP